VLRKHSHVGCGPDLVTRRTGWIVPSRVMAPALRAPLAERYSPIEPALLAAWSGGCESTSIGISADSAPQPVCTTACGAPCFDDRLEPGG